MTIDELLDMTPEQLKAWKKIESGVKAFKKAGGEFYTVLATVRGYNGKHVKEITGDERESHYPTSDVHMHSMHDAGLAGFADDPHFIHLTDKGEALLEGEY
ncbi:hypothetical protein [Serratia plymuthica]|uniref:hypothetical protein n=1 Tax=Serratia plymuthica TaxID=82996 RepID=UPI001AAEA264|nr:hypothetical protein [Serratia plymuthica]